MSLLLTATKVVEFTDKLEKQTEPHLRNQSRVDSGPNGAPRFLAMRTVTETAGASKIGEVTEDQANGMLGFPETETTDPRGVKDHSRTAGHQHQFAGRGRVAALGIARSDLSDLEQFPTDQRIDERRFPGTTFTHQRKCSPGAHQRPEITEAPTINDARHDDRS